MVINLIGIHRKLKMLSTYRMYDVIERYSDTSDTEDTDTITQFSFITDEEINILEIKKCYFLFGYFRGVFCMHYKNCI